jgi:hypothetical protein
VPTDYGVHWDFTATVTSIDSSLEDGCCQLALHVGDQVSGSIDLYSPLVTGDDLPYRSYLAVRLPDGNTVTVLGRAAPDVPVDGVGGDPDEFVISGPIIGSVNPFGLAPVPRGEGFGSLVLTNEDATAWSAPFNPRDPNLLPDYAPRLALFQTASVDFIYPHTSPTGLETHSGILLRIDRLPEPDPSMLVLAALTLLCIGSEVSARRPTGPSISPTITSG